MPQARHPSACPRPRGSLYAESAKETRTVFYQGLPIHADSPEVHEQALALLEKHLPRKKGVLDVGAGAGAFSRRLADHGFTDLGAVELRPEAFRVEGVEVHVLNLDDPWAGQLPRPYEAVIALEVIEHLENPWHFARQCAAAVRPGGLAVVSTPNIESSRSRVEFLLQAEFRFFRQKDYEAVGHITSLTARQMGRVFAQAGMDLVEHRRSRHKGVYTPSSPRKALRAALYALSYPFMRGHKQGEVSLFAFRKR